MSVNQILSYTNITTILFQENILLLFQEKYFLESLLIDIVHFIHESSIYSLFSVEYDHFYF